MKKIVTLFLIAVILFVFASSINGTKIAYAGNGALSQKEALKILQSLNPNIANYNLDTHLVTFKNGDKPIYVTPKGGAAHNGEVTWDYFVSNKGRIVGWSVYPRKSVLIEKSKMIYSFYKNHNKVNISFESGTGLFPHLANVNLTPCPQQHWNWCGPASTQAALTGWGIRCLKQADIAARENVPPDEDVGASENSIASTLNYYIGQDWYKVDSWGLNPKDLWNIFMVDIGYPETHKPFIAECDTIYLKDWRKNVSNGSTVNRVHYIAVNRYYAPDDNIPAEDDWRNAYMGYVDSATSVHSGLHSIVTDQKFYAGITYSYIPSGYTHNYSHINSFYNATLRWSEVD